MERRYILALVLMIVVMFAWSLLFGNRLAKQRATQQKERQQQAAEQKRETETKQTVDTSNGAIEPIEPTLQRPAKPGTPVHVQTNNYDVTFTNKSAIAKRWILRKYENRSGAGEPTMNLIPPNAQNCLSLQFFQPQLQDEFYKGQVVWQADKEKLTLTGSDGEDNSLTFSAWIGQNLKVYKKFTFYPDEYYVDMAVTFENVSNEPLTLLEQTTDDNQNGYKLRWGPGINADLLPHERKNNGKGRRPGGEGAKAYTGFGKPSRTLKDEEARTVVKWAGLNSNYFAALMIPDPALEAEYRFEELKDNGDTAPVNIAVPRETASLVVPGFSLGATDHRTDHFRLYVGPKESHILNQIQAPNALEAELGLSKIIDFGFFGPIAWAMLWLLNGMHAGLRNYGIAIILLTALVKLISFPLMKKSYQSMNKMKELQPLLTELKEKHRDDPQRLNKKTMQLYKEHGVNPLGGCIPWLPQIPIFWALFALLGAAVELRGAPFLLWMDDLSAPDVLYTLPFTIPLIVTQIDAIRILPIINGVTTFLQQKVGGGMAPATDNTQAKIMQFLPIFFVFIFYNWASGFVLYWLCNNVFTILQQYLTQQKDADKTEVVKTSPTSKQPQSKKRKTSKMKRS